MVRCCTQATVVFWFWIVIEAKQSFEGDNETGSEVEARIGAVAFRFKGFPQKQNPSSDSDREKDAGNDIGKCEREFLEESAVAE
jgi:hypothetical protein